MKNNKKAFDLIVTFVLIAILIAIAVFTATLETDNQEIVLMEIYKSFNPESNTLATKNYYIYENTNNINIRTSNSNGSYDTVSKNIDQKLIEDFKDALDSYLKNYTSPNSVFTLNERYMIKYNNTSIIVPNPSVATALGYDATKYEFYNTIEEFINNINN